MRIELFTTLGCHLCEEALALATQLQQSGMKLEITEVEIADSPELVEQYGIRIPVIRQGGREIGWPFNLTELQQFLTPSD